MKKIIIYALILILCVFFTKLVICYAAIGFIVYFVLKCMDKLSSDALTTIALWPLEVIDRIAGHF